MAAASGHWLQNDPIGKVAAVAAFLAFITLVLVDTRLLADGLSVGDIITGSFGSLTTEIIVAIFALASLAFAVTMFVIALLLALLP